MSSYSFQIVDNGDGTFTGYGMNTATTKPVGGTRLSIPWISNQNAGSTNFTVSAATTATPIAITTSAAHGLSTGDTVFISGGLVMTAVNGTFVVTVTSTTTATLDGSVGSGTYTASSATLKKLTPAKEPATVVQALLRGLLDDRASGN